MYKKEGCLIVLRDRYQLLTMKPVTNKFQSYDDVISECTCEIFFRNRKNRKWTATCGCRWTDRQAYIQTHSVW